MSLRFAAEMGAAGVSETSVVSSAVSAGVGISEGRGIVMRSGVGGRS